VLSRTPNPSHSFVPFVSLWFVSFRQASSRAFLRGLVNAEQMTTHAPNLASKCRRTSRGHRGGLRDARIAACEVHRRPFFSAAPPRAAPPELRKKSAMSTRTPHPRTPQSATRKKGLAMPRGLEYNVISRQQTKHAANGSASSSQDASGPLAEGSQQDGKTSARKRFVVAQRESGRLKFALRRPLSIFVPRCRPIDRLRCPQAPTPILCTITSASASVRCAKKRAGRSNNWPRSAV